LIQLFVSQTVKMVVNVYHQISVTAQVIMKETSAVKVKCTFQTTDMYPINSDVLILPPSSHLPS